MIKPAIHKLFRMFGLDIVTVHSQEQFPPDFCSDETQLITEVRPLTMTSAERIYALIHAVRYVSSCGIAGDIVECGVWKGGSMVAIARTLLQMQDLRRNLYLFDTFKGMSEPTPHDLDYSGKHASNLLTEEPTREWARFDWAPWSLR